MGLFGFNKKQALPPFPTQDERGKKALVLREVCIAGVNKTYDGISAQEAISSLSVGDKIVLSLSKNGVDVLTSNGQKIGVLPGWDNTSAPKVEYEVIKSLESGATVLARVKRLFPDAGAMQVRIEICRYAAK